MKAIIDPLFKDTRCVMSVSSRQFLFFFFAWENLQKKKKAEKWGGSSRPSRPACDGLGVCVCVCVCACVCVCVYVCVRVHVC